MKKISHFTASLFFFGQAAGATLELGEFDQAKLAEILHRLPETVSTRKVYKVSWFSRDYLIKTVFPITPNAFKIECESKFINDSPYPSYSACVVSVDKTHRNFRIKNDVVKILLFDDEEATAMFDAIPYGNPWKKFYSYGRHSGTTYDGIKGTVFHYQFLCLQTQCKLNFSNKALKD